MLLGREAERGRCRRLLDDARAGRSGALLVRGEPGIGKTALLAAARTEATGFRVLAARPVEAEARLAFAGLADLLRPVLERIDVLPSPQAAALRAALALGPPVVADRFAAYAATLGLLRAVAASGPVLVLVDDAHWLDAASWEGLAFASRRLDDERVAVLAGARTHEGDAHPGDGFAELTLTGLAEEPARALLARASGAPLAPGVAARVLGAAAGNPLALLELPRALTDRERRGEVRLDDPLPTGDAVTDAFRRALEPLPGDCRRALVVAAAAASERLAELGPALGAVGLGPAAFGAAERRGIVVIEGERLRFRHPLLRAVVRRLAPAAELRRAHRALAATLDVDNEPERHAWHLSAAALGPDEEAAAALEAAAAGAGARTGYAAAAAALRRAAELTADRERRAARLIGAANAAMLAGSSDVLSLLDQAAPLVRGSEQRVTFARTYGAVRLVTGPVDDAYELLVSEAGRIAAHDAAAAANMLAQASFSRAMAGRCREALATAQRAVALATGCDRATRRHADIMLFATLVLMGEARLFRSLAARQDDLEELDPLAPGGFVTAISVLPFVYTDALDQAERQINRLVETMRAAGALGLLGLPLTSRAELRLRSGRLAEGLADAREAMRLQEETGQNAPLGHAVVTTARFLAVLGDEDECRRHADRALALAESMGTGSLRSYAGHALGVLELGAGRVPAAVDALGTVAADIEKHGLRDPAVVPWRADYVEALCRAGRRAEAMAQLRVLAEEAGRSGNAWARAATARCRGLAAGAEADRHFGEALAWHDATEPMPFERARTGLAYGTVLRRLGRRRDARAQLGAARRVFDGLGARAWARQADEELAAAGHRPRPARPAAGGLTPRERQVALAVREGLTNREAGARLFLSEKTVERHLGAVYRKLGLRSRMQLVHALSDHGV